MLRDHISKAPSNCDFWISVIDICIYISVRVLEKTAFCVQKINTHRFDNYLSVLKTGILLEMGTIGITEFSSGALIARLCCISVRNPCA